LYVVFFNRAGLTLIFSSRWQPLLKIEISSNCQNIIF